MRGDNTLSPLRFVCLEEQSPPCRTLPEEAGESSNTGCGSSNCCSNVVNLFQSQRGGGSRIISSIFTLLISISSPSITSGVPGPVPPPVAAQAFLYLRNSLPHHMFLYVSGYSRSNNLFKLSIVSFINHGKKDILMFFNNFGPFFRRHFQLSEMRSKKLSK